MTIREALNEGSAALAAAGIENSGLDASLLLAETLNINRSSLIAAIEPVTEAQFADFRNLIQRRLAGECTAYILGRKEFFGLEFLVNPSTLVPRPDTETLVEAALEEVGSREWGVGSGGSKRERLAITNPSLCVLDLCTGCGAIAIALKHTMPELEVWATDISAEALEVAQANAARLLPPDAIHFCCGDLFEAYSEMPRRLDYKQQPPISDPHSPLPIILSNPPYIPSAEIAGLTPEVRREPILALDGGDDGLVIIRRIISGAPQLLCPGGVLLLEADPRQMKPIAALLSQAGFTGIQTRRDLSGSERVISGILEI